ncbi:hypothetical protein BKH46_07965 [Helicobacter sp. 12S02634-8]|uniref:hypothetical protein n=1 Tax=Helicobacter sp. 12S02634-8 TaxID=1476199 RepID=UPI000BA71F40|nr:hypothetical protein [Helicobacter sp. 12S02634-8]PAF46312.1 hypothetical protein BKH46_07965 [Helicobacter sp. 12S02634-8]
MKRIAYLSMFVFVLLYGGDVNIRDLYNKSQQNTPQSPNNFLLQDTLGKMYSEDVLDAANSQDTNSFKDGPVADRFGPQTDDPDDMGAKGIGGYVKSERLGVRKKAMEASINVLGNVAKQTGRATCYLARSQSFFNYRCSLNGTTYASSDAVDSPSKAKSNCENNCRVMSACLTVTNPLDKQIDDQKEIIADALALSKDHLSTAVERSFSTENKIKVFEFTIKNNVDVLMNFSYIDESGFERVMATNLMLKAQSSQIFKNGGEKKKYTINSKIKSVKLEFIVSKDADLSGFNDDNPLKVMISKALFLIPKVNRFVCSQQNIANKPAAKNTCSKSDLVELVSNTGERILICKANKIGDNEDGTFSNKNTCSASCYASGVCSLESPALSVDSFFGFKEGCLGGESDSCKNNDCIAARENNAPILNETVFDGQGNAIQTIKNGAVVSGTVRPRVLASNDMANYQNKIKEEGKDRAFTNMIQDQTYAVSKVLGSARQSSYAVRTKGQEIYARFKPSDGLYGKKAYLYVMVELETSDQNYYANAGTQRVHFRSKYYYMLGSDNKLHSFYVDKGYNFSDYKDNQDKFRHFNETSLSWIEGGRESDAPIFKVYSDILNELGEHKFFIEEKLFTNKLYPTQVKGPVRSRAYALSASGGDVATDPNGEGGTRGTLLAELYQAIGQDKKNIPNYLIRLNHGQPPLTSPGDIPSQYKIFVLATEKPLTHKEIADELILKDTTGINLIYNLLEDKTNYITQLKDDSSQPSEYVSVYLVGNLKKLSAYASFTPRQDEIQENGYAYLWWQAQSADQDKTDIGNLKPSDKSIFEYYEHLSPAYELVPLFENQDLSARASQKLYFGYGSGKYDSKADCKDFIDHGNFKRICLPWWRIEREYDSKIDKTIPDESFQKAMRAMSIPMAGKLVEVCTQIDPAANAIFNGEAQKVNCTSYYNKLAGDDCFTNPMQRKCFYDNCPTKIKENCKLVQTLAFSNLKSEIATPNPLDKDGIQTSLQDTRLETKSYTYECPASKGSLINHVCLKQEQVTMNPANCNESSVVSDEDKIKLHSNYIYCDTHRPIMDASGNLTGFKGTCPNTKKEVVCGINQMQTTTKTCTVPLFETETYEDVQVETVQRVCKDVSVNVSKGDEDIYLADPTCLRTNTAADSRKGSFTASFTNNQVGGTLIVSENYKDQEKIDYCKYEGIKHGSLPKDCRDSGHGVMNFRAQINDSQQIIFATQIGTLNNGENINGIILNLGLPELGDPTYRKIVIHNDIVPSWAPALNILNAFTLFRKPFKQEGYGLGDYFLENGYSRPFRALIQDTYFNDSLNYYAPALAGQVGYGVIQLAPETTGSNFNSAPWVQRTYLMPDRYKNPGDCKCISNNCDFESWYDVDKDYRCNYHPISRLKVFNNATLGVSIILPTPSDYEFSFYNKAGQLIAKESISRVRLTATPAGTLQNISLVSDLKTSRMIELQDKLIPQKEKEIQDLKDTIASISPIQEVVLSYGARTQREKREEKKGHGCKFIEHIFWSKYNIYECTYWDVPLVNGGNNSSLFNRIASQGVKVNERVCVGNYAPSTGPDTNFNKLLGQGDCDYQKRLETLQKELEDFKTELKEESPRRCSNDPWSPIGGGTLFGQDSISGSAGTLMIKTPRLIELEDVLIPKKQNELQAYIDEVNSIYSSNVVEVTLSYGKRTEQIESDDNDYERSHPNCRYNTSPTAGVYYYDCDFWDIPFVNGEKNVDLFKRLSAQGAKVNEKIVVTHYDPSKPKDPNFNKIIGKDYQKKIDLLEKQLEVLEQEEALEATKTKVAPACEFNRDLTYLRDNSIYSIGILDKETGDVTIKKLEFPFPFANRIFFTYLKSVEERKYKCCQDF